jgi:hypothetical protein
MSGSLQILPRTKNAQIKFFAPPNGEKMSDLSARL